MNISDQTLSILKNFSEINTNILLRPGKTIRTMSPQKTVMAAATIDDDIPSEAGIFDLSRFLATISLFKNPDIDFQSEKFIIAGGKSKVSYTYAAPSMIVCAPDKELPVNNVIAKLSIKWEDIQNARRAAGVLQLTEIAFIGNGTTVSMAAVDTKNSTADIFEVEVGEVENSGPFKMVIKVDNLKLLPSDYEVSLSSNGVAFFKSDKVRYWIAIEAR